VASSSQDSSDPSTSPAPEFGRDRPVRKNWLQVPNQFWTVDLRDSDLRVIGWLHSHEPGYLARLSVRRAAEELGKDRRNFMACLERLAEAGAVRIVKDDPGFKTKVIILADWWESLDRGMCTKRAGGCVPDAPGDVYETRHREDYLRRPVENLTGFDEFWDLYPRKVAKGDAEKAWRGTSPADRILALARLRLPNNGIANVKGKDNFTPYPATWLRAAQWLDELPAEAHTPGGRTPNPRLQGAVKYK